MKILACAYDFRPLATLTAANLLGEGAQSGRRPVKVGSRRTPSATRRRATTCSRCGWARARRCARRGGSSSGWESRHGCERCRSYSCRCRHGCERCRFWSCRCRHGCERCRFWSYHCRYGCKRCCSYSCRRRHGCERCRSYSCRCRHGCERCRFYSCRCRHGCERCRPAGWRSRALGGGRRSRAGRRWVRSCRRRARGLLPRSAESRGRSGEWGC